MLKTFSAESEKHLLGCMLQSNEIIDDVLANVNEEYFTVGNHRRYFNRIKKLYEENGSCDILMLANEGLAKDMTEVVCLTEDIISGVNYEYYIKDLTNIYQARSTNAKLGELKEKLTDKNVTDTLYELDDFVNKHLENSSKNKPVSAKQMAIAGMEMFEDRARNKGKLRGYDTGFSKLNSLTDGFQKGELIAVGARPSLGKSAFADQLSFNFASSHIPTVTFSLEMTANEIQERRVARLSNINIKKLRSGYYSAADMQRINQATQRIFDVGEDCLMYDSTTISCEFKEIESKIRIHAKQGYKIFFIDHIGLLECEEKKDCPEWERISYMSKRLKQLANKLGIVIVIVCQLTRDVEGKDPELNSLRGSGSIEQDSNTVIMIHRERQHSDEIKIATKIKVVKCRGGACGDMDFEFYPNLTKFVEVSDEKEMSPTDRNQEKTYEQKQLF